MDQFLGRGGMGEVWLATEMGIQLSEIQQVVLKVVPPELQRSKFEMDKIQKSFDLIRKLRHPNICSALTFAMDEKYGYFLVMDYVSGIELSELQLQQPGGVFTFEQTIEILEHIATALDYAHKKKIIHRDIKPQNVMVPMVNGVPQLDELKLIDFGLAAEYRSTQSIDLESKKFNISGTLPYMPPEQISGTHQDSRTDQYALGVMAYQMLSGQLPFTSMAPAVLMHKVLNSPPEKLGHLPAHVNSVLCRVMAKNRNLRYATCADFIAALKSGKMEKPTPLTRPGQPEPAAPKRYGLYWICGGSVLCVLLFAAMYVHVLSFLEPTTGTTVEAPDEPSPLVSLVGRKLIAVKAPDDRALNVLDRATKEIVRTFPGPKSDMRGFPAVSPDGKLLAVAYANHEMRLFELESAKLRYTLQARGTFMEMAFSADASCLFTLDIPEDPEETCIRIWDVQTGESLYDNPEALRANAFILSPDGSQLATVNDDEITIYDTVTLSVIRQWELPQGHIRRMRYTRDGKHLISLESENDRVPPVVRFWDVQTGTSVRELRPDVPSGGWEMATSSDDQALFLTVAGQDFVKIDAQTGEILETAKLGKVLRAVSPDGREILSGRGDDMIRLWDAGRMEILDEFHGVGKKLIAVFVPERVNLSATGPTLAQKMRP